MEEVNFIQNQETHDLRQGHIAHTLSCHDIPLFWSGHQHLETTQAAQVKGLLTTQPSEDPANVEAVLQQRWP